MKKNTLLVYFLSDYFDSYLNLFTSVEKLGLLDSENIYSILVYQSIESLDLGPILDKFDQKIKENCYSDLFAYFKALKFIKIKDFKYFIFMNSSCIGPILPSYNKKFNWESIFTNNLEKYGMISPIIEFPPYEDKNVLDIKLSSKLSNLFNLKTIPFAHSYFLSLNKKALFCLIDNNSFPKKDINRDLAVGHFERIITAVLLNEGFKIKSLLNKYNSLEIEKEKINIFLESGFFNSNFTDPEIPIFGYFGSDIHPYEVVFFKNIRHTNSHRGEKNAGISETNFKFLEKIVGLEETRIFMKNKINSKSSFKNSLYLFDKYTKKSRSKNDLFSKQKIKILKVFKKIRFLNIFKK